MIIFIFLVGFGLFWLFGKTEKTIGNSNLDDKTKQIIMIVIAIIFVIAYSLM